MERISYPPHGDSGFDPWKPLPVPMRQVMYRPTDSNNSVNT